MSWECLRCGQINEGTEYACTNCSLDKETALIYVVSKPKKYCEECGHIHREDTYCHVYVEAADDGDDEDVISESGSDTQADEYNSSDDDLSLGIVKSPKKKAEEEDAAAQVTKMKPLVTPHHIKKLGYIRCNCNVGVPSESKRFVPIPKYVYVGPIQIQTFAEINYPSDRNRHAAALAEKFPESGAARREADRLTNIASNIPHILSFLPLSQCSMAPQVSTYWNWGANLYTEFIDMRNCVPWQVFRPHFGQTDSVLVLGKFVYSGGDKRVLVSDYEKGEVVSMITRDSGSITYLFEKEAELFVCSSNGSIRTYQLTHTGKNIKMATTMWEHSRGVTHLITSLPSNGICRMHGIENHVCTLYTSSDDRTVKMWNIQKYVAVRSIQSKAIREATFTRVAQSDRHLFVGTSNATVAVFCKTPHCEREDVHTCNIKGNDQSYCLQISLKLPPITVKSGAPASVTGLICVDIDFPFSHLWAADSSGQLTIWHVPETGLSFIPAHTVKAHEGPINNLLHTHTHAITISDDGYVVFFNMVSFDRIRSLNILEWSVEYDLIKRPDIRRKVKCAHLQEDHENGGNMVVGTSYGDVIMLRLGTTV
mmetsp:Transcript_3604/g.5616  ORF Transcript_3604/g.5616 Transcript_3604/m.5616 type:complete len:595 (-) Transcript_3604:1566-3350(-)